MSSIRAHVDALVCACYKFISEAEQNANVIRWVNQVQRDQFRADSAIVLDLFDEQGIRQFRKRLSRVVRAENAHNQLYHAVLELELPRWCINDLMFDGVRYVHKLEPLRSALLSALDMVPLK